MNVTALAETDGDRGRVKNRVLCPEIPQIPEIRRPNLTDAFCGVYYRDVPGRTLGPPSARGDWGEPSVYGPLWSAGPAPQHRVVYVRP